MIIVLEALIWSLIVFIGISIPFIAVWIIRLKYQEYYYCNHLYIWSIGTCICMIGGMSCIVSQARPLEDLIVAFSLLSVLLLATVTDIWTRLVPNAFTYSGIILLLIIYLFSGIDSFSFLMILVRFCCCLLLFYLLARATGSLGIGDVKLIAMSSICLDVPLIFFALWIASVSALILLSVWVIRGKKVKRKMAIPFAPHLAIGIYSAFIFAPMHLEWTFLRSI